MGVASSPGEELWEWPGHQACGTCLNIIVIYWWWKKKRGITIIIDCSDHPCSHASLPTIKLLTIIPRKPCSWCEEEPSYRTEDQYQLHRCTKLGMYMYLLMMYS